MVYESNQFSYNVCIYIYINDYIWDSIYEYL
jgi:hypothetical protein